MNAEDYDKRFANLEARLAAIEARMQTGAAPKVERPLPDGALAARVPPAPTQQPKRPPQASSDARDADARTSIGTVLGWGGGIAFLLAAAYLVRLAIDAGWLTPLRQVALAALLGVAMIAAGFALRHAARSAAGRNYAALLPAVGIGILFIAIYGGHLYHHVLDVRQAGAAVVVVCAVSLWLCKAFDSDLYALFAVAGSYSAPFLLANPDGSLSDLAVYFTAWGLVFCVFAIWRGSRAIYLLALYLALLGFDAAARLHGVERWQEVIAFQSVQFVLFGVATALYSVRREEPLDRQTALLHLPPLLLFYFLQYSLLDRSIPGWAPWIAVASLALLAALYGLARIALRRELPGGELLLWCYVALVLFHAGYLQSVPNAWAPWVALAAVPVFALLSARADEIIGARWPVWLALGLVFAVNCLRVLFNADLHAVPHGDWLAAAYAVLLYAGYAFCRARDVRLPREALVYLGHLCAMAAAVRLIGVPIIETVAWAVLAVVVLGLSVPAGDAVLRRSSLWIFAACAAKLMLFDLAGAAPVARIIGLIVIGSMFYFGGMLYQRLRAP
jgi:uncharacterized membrane protein